MPHCQERPERNENSAKFLGRKSADYPDATETLRGASEPRVLLLTITAPVMFGRLHINAFGQGFLARSLLAARCRRALSDQLPSGATRQMIAAISPWMEVT
ncbi:hypothetical protein, partial [Rhodoblastus acidophilus]|uniref:hypothetical protein n=1 Tax=Rhodoblastus acidophilus TaxID=1074 RepID=UPI00222466C0